jgi:hypothetical protein
MNINYQNVIEEIRALKNEILDNKRKEYAINMMKNSVLAGFMEDNEIINIKIEEMLYYKASDVIDEVLKLLEAGKVK